MFLNVDMMLLPLRGYRQGCHRSPLWTALPIVIGIVPGSHRYIFYCLFWTFFNGPSLLNLWPFSVGPHLNINVSIIGLQCWGHGLRHDFPSPGAAHEDLDVRLLAVCSPVSPYTLKGQGGYPVPSLYICIKGGLSPDCTRLLPIFPVPLFTWGPTC
jgi:hypothetical protein